MSKKIIKTLAEYQFIIIYLMKFLGTMGIAGCIAEGHPYASAVVLATAAGLLELNTYIEKNKDEPKGN